MSRGPKYLRPAVLTLLALAPTLLFAGDDKPTVAGTELWAPPDVPPGRVAPLPPDPLRAAIDARTQGDLPRAAWLYGQALAHEGMSSATRSSVWLALGEVQLSLGQYNEASADLGRARSGTASVAPWAAWYQARADHARGKDNSAAATCATYIKTWPTAPHADECLVLMGDAYAANGLSGAAVASYKKYMDAHPDSPREETLKLKSALAISVSNPSAAIPTLQELAVDHEYHSTGASARARLDELAAKGFPAALPQTPQFRCREALEEKRCGFEQAAWTDYQAIEAESQTDAPDAADLASWIDAQQDNFEWGTKQYDALAQRLADAYAAKPDARTAWDRYRALARGGRWVDAVKQLELGLKDHGTTSYFRGQREELARDYLLAGEYKEARDAWTALGKNGGGAGREARWLAAYAAFRAGDYSDALTRLDAVIASNAPETMAARYYRSRTLRALKRVDEAEVARAEIVRDAPMSWYAVLIDEGLDRLPDPPPSEPPEARWTHRAGRWPGNPTPKSAGFHDPGTGGVAFAPLPVTTSPVGVSHIDWAAMTAFVAGSPVAPPSVPPPSSLQPPASSLAPALQPPASSLPTDARPDSYAPGFLFDPKDGDKFLSRLGVDHVADFPYAAAAADLARAGNFDDAAPIVSHIYDDLEARHDGGALYASLGLSVEDWRQIAYFTRDDYHAARFSWGADQKATTPAEHRIALSREFPTAQADALYRHGQAYDVDPLLVLGLMRQESVYRQWALSPTGAIGLMQVMPRTGARVAALMGDASYSPEILEDPSTNVRYGVWYLSRLLDRFDGSFPLAVASYNGGPHNVSAWLRPWGATIRMDDFVEQIPFPESRDYVKKVTGYYATYVALYGPSDAAVDVPWHPAGDDATVIDF